MVLTVRGGLGSVSGGVTGGRGGCVEMISHDDSVTKVHAMTVHDHVDTLMYVDSFMVKHADDLASGIQL